MSSDHPFSSASFSQVASGRVEGLPLDYDMTSDYDVLRHTYKTKLPTTTLANFDGYVLYVRTLHTAYAIFANLPRYC